MEPQWITLLIGLVGIVLNTIIFVVSFTWKLSSVAADLRKGIIENRDAVLRKMDTERREIGETLSALREKINSVELEASKTYLRRESWHQAMNQLQAQYAASEKAADERWLRIEAKIDRITDRLGGVPMRPAE